MPVGIVRWRAGIFCHGVFLRTKPYYQIPLREACLCPFIPVSALAPPLVDLQICKPTFHLVMQLFFSSFPCVLCTLSVYLFLHELILLLSGDIELNPGPHIENCVRFFHWNLNSICARNSTKVSLIEAYNSVYKYDVIALSETMLDSSVSDEDIYIKGFSKDVLRNDHPSNTKVGGVCLYFREGLPITRRKDHELLPETIVAEIKIGRKKLFIVTVYRSPSQNSEQFEVFMRKLQMIVTRLRHEKSTAIIITGDFNCRSSQFWEGDDDHPERIALDEFIEINNLHQLINEPTNIRCESMSCIDLIITDQPNLFVESGVHPSLDVHCQHQLVYGKLNLSMPSPPPYKRTIWDYTKADIQYIRNAVSEINWKSRFSGLDPNKMVEVFTTAIYSLLSLNIPNKVVKFDDKDAPWVTAEVKTAIRRKHRVYRKYLDRGRKLEDWMKVKDVKRETSKKILDAKESYYLGLGRKLSDPNNGIKTYWSTLNRLMNKKSISGIPPILENGTIITNVVTKANILNNYFGQQCSEIPTGSTVPSFIPRCNAYLSNIAINRCKVLQLIRALDPKKAGGSDNISVHMIKICDASIVEPLCLIFEKSLDVGTFPSAWKEANIVPIHKKGCRQNKTNYRPISLLPIFGKIFEKAMFDQIYQHLCENGLLVQQQSGFRPGDSTINQLLSITQNIYKAFEACPSLETRAVFLDLSKAFDRVWHKGLLFKLKCNGINGNLLTLIESYLADRKQRVVLNGKCSVWVPICAGVPQGSVLGPLFFLIYMNDLIINLKCDVKMFADDTSLFKVVDDIRRSADELNADLEKVKLWAWQWKMQFNASKTEEVVFSCKKVKPSHPPALLGNDIIDRKSQHKHLGMQLDSGLNFQSHVREAIGKARRGIGMIRYLSKYVSRDVLDQVYKLYVRPHLDYGDIIYHKYDPKMSLSFTQRLEQTQYYAALAVTGAWRGTNRQRLYEELGWESLYHRRWYRRLCHFFKLLLSRSPGYLFDEIPPERQIVYNLRNARDYEVHSARTNRFSNTYFYNTLFEWNLLDEEIKNSASLSIFKNKLLKTIRPPKKSIYNICDIEGVGYLTKLRLRFSLLNEHKFRHNFDSLTPLCACGMNKEDNEHFFLHCPQFDLMRQNLFGQLSHISGLTLNLDDNPLCELLLFGDPRFSVASNSKILEATISFIKNTKRFSNTS